MSVPTSYKTKFWIVCCEETEATQAISSAVDGWQLPGVRSLHLNQSPLAAETVSQADYAIFITPYAQQPCSQIKVSPLRAQQPNPQPQSPAALLSDAHSRYGQSPQAWWFQLPTTEMRARRVQPISTQKSVAQALNQIEVFVRNYRLAIAPKTIRQQSQSRQQLITAQMS